MKVKVDRITGETREKDIIPFNLNTYGVCLGDSITAGEATRGFYPKMLGFMSNGKYMLTNKGISGNWTADMLARFKTDVVALNPKFVIINGGKNDISNGVALATICANIVAMVRLAYDNGIEPILSTIIPYGASGFTATQKLHTTQVNQWIRYFCLKNGIRFIDFYKDFVDPATGWAKAANIHTDNLHPSSVGMTQLATTALNMFSQAVFTGYDDSLNVDTCNLIANPTFSTDTNSDGLADGWTVGNYGGGITPVCTLVEHDKEGNWQNVVITGGNTDVSINLYQAITASGNFTAGDTLIAECDYKINSVTPFDATCYVAPRLIYTGAPVQESDLFTELFALQGRGIEPYVVASGQTSLFFMLSIRAVTDIDVSISRVRVYKLVYPITL